MTYARWVVLLMVSGLVAGCFGLLAADRLPKSVQADLNDGEELIIYSLEGGHATPSALGPNGLPDQASANQGEDYLHGWRVLGKTTITDLRTRLQIGNAMREGANNHDRSVVTCFDPNHAVRIRSKKKTTDLMISFRCGQVKVFENDQFQEFFTISKTPRPLLNQILRDAKVPLAPGAN